MNAIRPLRTHLKIPLAASLFAGLSLSALAQTTSTIDFDTTGNWVAGAAAIGSYSDHSFNEASWSFTSADALRNTTTAQDGFPGALGTYSWRLRNNTGTFLQATYTDAMTIEGFGFEVRRWDNSPDCTFVVEYSTDSGSTFTPTGITINSAFLDSSSNWKTLTYTLPSPATVTAGQFVIKVYATGTTERIMIDDFQWTTSAGPPDETDPTLVSFTPANASPAVLTNTAYTLTYDEPMAAGTGTVTIKKVFDDSVIETITVPSAQVEFLGNEVQVFPSVLLGTTTEYYVEVSAGAFTDTSANPAAAAGGSLNWAFTTRGASSVLISQYYEGIASEDRYVELKNLTGSPLLLDGYVLAAWSHSDPAGREGWKTGTDTTTRVTPLDGLTIPANGNLLVAQIGASVPGYAGVNNDLSDDGGTTAFNGDDSVVLYNGTGFTLPEVVDAVSITAFEGTDISFYRVSDGPGFDFASGTSILDYTSAWASKTLSEVDSATISDDWYLAATQAPVELSLSIVPATFSEGAGSSAATATVTRTGPTDEEIFVSIASSDESEATAQIFVSIGIGNSDATFPIDAVNDPYIDGDHDVTFTVTADGYSPASQVVTVQDEIADPVFPVVINEVDADTFNTDTEEFIELFNPSGASVSLDGVVLVLYNGNGDTSYDTIDLTGKSIGANDFFVIGSASVPNVDMEEFTTDGIQNGADAVALYLGNAIDFPNGSPVNATNGTLLDALVYDTSDADDTDLLTALTPGSPQVNENSTDSATQSMARLPDGGAAFDTTLYVTQAPTPGVTNVIPLNNFATWIDGFFPGETNPDFVGFGADPDFDGVSNGVEALIGGNPNSPGVFASTELTKAGSTFSFLYPKSKTVPPGVTASYEWSTDLANWQGDGDSFGGVTVTLSELLWSDTDPEVDIYQVSAEVTAGTAPKIFVRVVANN